MSDYQQQEPAGPIAEDREWFASATWLGSYESSEGERELLAFPRAGRMCVIDRGLRTTLLVEPALDGTIEARALAADYLPRAAEQGEPQTRLAWPPRPRDRAAGRAS